MKLNIVNSCLVMAALSGALSVVSCSSESRDGRRSSGDTLHTPKAARFHADHDIGMLVRSIMDAIKVGEILDSTVYNGVYILTDGTGRPLYLDVSDAPGKWVVKVVSESSAEISNISDGDLSGSDLREYVLMCTGIDSSTGKSAIDKKEETVSDRYLFGEKGEITFTDRRLTEGSMMSILIEG